jgi:cytochrome c oxidase subunit 4
MNQKGTEHKPVSYGSYVAAWLSLVVLTALTVTVAGMHLKGWSIGTALVIACVKSTLVLFVFMHLKQEKPFFKITMLVVVVTITIFIGLTFVDILFR